MSSLAIASNVNGKLIFHSVYAACETPTVWIVLAAFALAVVCSPLFFSLFSFISCSVSVEWVFCNVHTIVGAVAVAAAPACHYMLLLLWLLLLLSTTSFVTQMCRVPESVELRSFAHSPHALTVGIISISWNMSSLISVHYYIYGCRCKTFCRKDAVFWPSKSGDFHAKSLFFLWLYTLTVARLTVTFSLKCNRHHAVAASFCRIVVFTVVQRATDFIGCNFDAKRAFLALSKAFYVRGLCVARSLRALVEVVKTPLFLIANLTVTVRWFFVLSRISSLKCFDHS